MTSTARDAARGFLTPQKPPSLRPTSLASPHTPVSRLSSQLYGSQAGSPSGTTALHQLDEPLIFDIGTRFIRAGLANEESPRCVIEMRPEYFGRVGLKGKGGTRADVRSGTKGGPRFQETGSEAWELWSGDLRDKDIGVVEDLLERMLREAYNKYLLLDSKSKRLLVILPPLLPTPLQTCLTQILFTHFQPPTITYMSSPVLVTIAAGLRSALVVDIGWHETIVTPIYDLRPLTGSMRASNRGSKRLIECTGELLWNTIKDGSKQKWWEALEWEDVENLVTRMCWTQSTKEAKEQQTLRARKAFGLSLTEEAEKRPGDDYYGEDNSDLDESEQHGVGKSQKTIYDASVDFTINHSSSSQKRSAMKLPFKSLSFPPELAFFQSSSLPITSILEEDIVPIDSPDELLTSDTGDLDLEDDCDLTLSHLVFSSLLHLRVDIRSVCLPRIIITGGASNIPGLKSRIIGDVRELVKSRGGWNVVRPRKLYGEQRKEALITKEAEPHQEELLESQKEALRKQHIKTGGVPRGTIRAVESLGAWAGGSIIAGARIKGAVEVEREKFFATVAAGGSGFSS